MIRGGGVLHPLHIIVYFSNFLRSKHSYYVRNHLLLNVSEKRFLYKIVARPTKSYINFLGLLAVRIL